MNIPVNVFRAVASAISKDPTRYVLNGIEVAPKKDGVVLCATNGHILIFALVEGEHNFKDPFIIPSYLANYIGSKTDLLSVELMEETVFLKTRITQFGATVVDGNFPAWRTMMRPKAELAPSMPSGFSPIVTDVIYKAQKALGIPRSHHGIHKVFGERGEPAGVRYMQLGDNIVTCFMPTRKAAEDAGSFNWPEWV